MSKDTFMLLLLVMPKCAYRKQILVQEEKIRMSVFFLFVLQGWFSPGQVFVLDEYCARYGVRGCHRHLCYLTELMEHSENGAVIDPTLLHYSFAFCASHVHGNRYFDLQMHSKMYRVDWKREKNVLCHYHLVTDFK
jgi:hypothetical protein